MKQLQAYFETKIKVSNGHIVSMRRNFPVPAGNLRFVSGSEQ